MSCEAILFDLDGTLLDTIGDLADAMNAALGELGCPQRTLAECRFFVGDGLVTYARRALPEGRRDAQTVEQCCEAFRARYAECWDVKTRPFEGIGELLTDLTRRGLAMAVLSNKPDDFTSMMVREMLGDWTFQAVRGVRDDGVKKPDPAGALAIAEEIDVRPEEFLYLGDTNTDMQTANAAGMYAVGATWGFRPAGELADNGARVLIDHPTDLLKLL